MATILVVDDIEDNIFLLRFSLEDDGHRVISASSGQQCLEKTRSEQPDLILLDIMMPDMTGIEVLTQLKEDHQLYDIPVIMVSAKDDDSSIIDALDIGAYDYATKPFIYPVLAARIRSALRLREDQKQLLLLNEQLSRLASLDSLTEIYNRRHFLSLATVEYSKTVRYSRAMAILMLDVDKFKAINDTYGHPAGDAALKQLTQDCQLVCRSTEVIGRFGGEEFAICCPDTDLQGAIALAERLRTKVESNHLHVDDNDIQFTISIGVTCTQEEDSDVDDLLRRADRFLYQAKETGRNKAVNDLNFTKKLIGFR